MSGQILIFGKFTNLIHIIKTPPILCFLNFSSLLILLVTAPYFKEIGLRKNISCQLALNFLFQHFLNRSKRMGKNKVQSKNVFTNTPKWNSGKCCYRVGILIAKFTLMKVSKRFYIKSQTRSYTSILSEIP